MPLSMLSVLLDIHFHFPQHISMYKLNIEFSFQNHESTFNHLYQSRIANSAYSPFCTYLRVYVSCVRIRQLQLDHMTSDVSWLSLS